MYFLMADLGIVSVQYTRVLYLYLVYGVFA